MPDDPRPNTQFPALATVRIAYASTNPDPISFVAGELIQIKQSYTEDPEWSNWIKCENSDGKSGWTPLQVLRIDGEWATTLTDYTAHELTVREGEQLAIQKVINGWAWARKSSGEWGWVPLRNLT